MGQPNPWGQPTSPPPGPFNSLTSGNQASPSFPERPLAGGGLSQTPLPPRRPYEPPQQAKLNPRLLFLIAGLFVVLAAILLSVVFALSQSGNGGNTSSANSGGGSNPNAVTATATPQATPTTSDATPDAGATPTDASSYPGQQYIPSAQMASGIDKTTLQAVGPTTSFKVGSTMYVVYTLHAPDSGGAVCAYWYLEGKQVTSYISTVHPGSKGSYTYANYGSPGDSYVELYWASNKSCSDKVLAQKVTFTVVS